MYAISGFMTFYKRKSSGRKRKIIKKSKNAIKGTLDILYNYFCVHVYVCVFIGLIGRVFTNGLGDRGSVPGRGIQKTQKILLDFLLNIQHYKLWIKGKVDQPMESCSPFSYTLVK